MFMPETYKRFGVKLQKIRQGLSIGACLSYDRYFGEYYLYINLIKWEICIGWLSDEKED